MNDLLNRHCTPIKDSGPMSAVEIGTYLPQVIGWHVINGAIEKKFQFKNFHETMAFTNALAWICHTQDHHPEMALTYNRCAVRFNTHSVGGISINDFICAARVNSLLNGGV